MSEPPGTLLQFSSVSKDYHGLRPLRIDNLSIGPGELIAILGLDQPAAEVFVNLATGAMLPDRGDVVVLGQSTRTIRDSDEWLTLIDHIGIVSPRVVLLEALSVVQNLAVPFSLDLEPLPQPLRERAETAGREVGLSDPDWDRPAAEISASARVRVWLARALALDPVLVVLEHPTGQVQRAEVSALGAAIRGVLVKRRVAAVMLTADGDFAAAAASRVLMLDPSTGRLSERQGWLTRLRNIR